VLDIRGEDPQALQALGELCTRRERWEELVEIIERQIAATQGEQDQIRLYKQLGRVWEGKLARERNALDAWLAADRLDGNDLETLRSLARLYRSTQSWDELSQTLRRIIEVGQVTGAIDESETIELYAQLGQLEGEVLGRVDDAVDAWRRVIRDRPSDFRALAALEALFTREGRWEEGDRRAREARAGARRRGPAPRDPAPGRRDLGGEGRGADPRGPRSTSASRVGPVQRHRERPARGDLHPAVPLDRAGRVLLERSELRPSVEEQLAILKPGRPESTSPRSAIRSRRSTCCRPRSSATTRTIRPPTSWSGSRPPPTAGRSCSRRHQRVNELEHEDRGSAADLWSRSAGGTPSTCRTRVRDHSVQQALRIDPSHTGALAGMAELQRKRGSWSELIETLQRHAAVEPSPEKKTELYIQLAELLERQNAGHRRGDPRLPAGAGLRPGVARRAGRARPAVPPHRAVGAADRRDLRGAPSLERRRRDRQAPPRDRPDLGPPAVRRRPGDSTPTRRCSRSTRPT